MAATNEMNEWLLFALFALLLAVMEFVSRRAANAVAASMPPEERRLPPRRQLRSVFPTLPGTRGLARPRSPTGSAASLLGTCLVGCSC
jgi:hypothetical protein